MPTSAPGQAILTRLTREMLDTFGETGFWREDTIHSLARAHAAARPQSVAIRDSNASLTYRELVELADRLAESFTRNGLVPGDRVALWLSNRVETAIVLLACSRNGYVLCPSLHRNHTVDEISELLCRMRAKALVAEEGYGADAERQDIFAVAAGIEELSVVHRLKPPSRRGTAEIAEAFGAWPEATSEPSGRADHIVYLAFTSGTTGEPKGVMHSNNTLLANARAIGADWNFDSASTIYTLSPLSHNLGFGALVLTMCCGGSIVLHDLGRGKSLLERLRETRATFVFGVPAHAMDLLEEIRREGAARLDRLKGFRISGAPASEPVVEGLLSYGIVPQSGYGMTEAGSHHYTLPDDGPNRIVATSGRACPGYEVAIFAADDPDHRLERGAVGQIGGRGASLMLGYFADQNATERAFNRDGWFMTGDLGWLDEAGYLKITGRIKDVIIRGGHNIHPARIEQLAMRHASVERAAAVPVADERLGEKVCIVVMPKNGATRIEPEKLMAHLHEQGLSKYDMPEYFLQVDEIPLGPSGKMLKRALLPHIQEGRLTPQPVRWGG